MLEIIIFMLGASVASFIFVYLERGESDKFFSTKNRSICPNCLRKLNFYELVPIFSYLFLKGKCKTCKTVVPSRLFYGEIVLGVWFLVSYFYYTDNLLLFFLCIVFGSIFFLLTVEDVENMEVSSKFLDVLLFLGCLTMFIRLFLEQNIFEVAILPIIIISPFWLIYFSNKSYIGSADPMIYSALALFFGAQFSVSLFLYSVWFGAFYGVVYSLVVYKRYVRKLKIPFIPIIFFSTLFILITNYHIIQIQDILILNEIFF